MPLHRRRTSRRGLLGAGARAGVGALGLALVGCADRPSEIPALGAGESPAWFKDTAPFILHDDGKSLEARLELMRGLITPPRLFFVRNNSVSLDVDAARWRLSVEGDAVGRPRELSYADLLDMPSRTLVSYLECAGNQRAMFDLVEGRAAGGTQWGTGGVGNGVWTGVSLRDVLAAAGVRDDAVSVLLIGLDTESPEQGFRRVLPIEKARHPDTLLAYALNGEALPRDHGFPLRALVPGWVGSSSIKWLGRIIVSAEPLWTRNNTTSYVLIGDDYPPEGEALGTVVTEQSIKSALALPWPATLASGSQRIRGYAQSPHGPITRVEWSADDGATWRDAAVLDPQPQYSWARFEFTWAARPGEHVVMTRATDASGAVQPDDVPFNKKGYLFNRPLPHPISVG
ncbi:MAG: sulfite oxidase [Chloroflexi bacterium]|nr:sulfite oxidase [Chloroflexota bacterium]